MMALKEKKHRDPDLLKDVGDPPVIVGKDEQVPLKAYRIRQFCQAYNVSRSLAYKEIKAGRLQSTTKGRCRVIGVDEAEDWFRRL